MPWEALHSSLHSISRGRCGSGLVCGGSDRHAVQPAGLTAGAARYIARQEIPTSAPQTADVRPDSSISPPSGLIGAGPPASEAPRRMPLPARYNARAEAAFHNRSTMRSDARPPMHHLSAHRAIDSAEVVPRPAAS